MDKSNAPNIKIIDYKAGNAPSVMHAADRLGYDAAFARRPSDLPGATHIILPGVGSAKATMESLREMDMLSALEEEVLFKNVFFHGVCVGMQILFEHSEEEDTDCLGWMKGGVVKFDVSKVRVPQIGWNEVHFVKDSSIAAAKDGFFYFVNSYYARPANETDVWGVADYGGRFTAAIAHGNIFASQFHMEKSGEAGLRLLNGFFSLGNGGNANAD